MMCFLKSKKHIPKQAGFTVIETLVYLFIFIVVSIAGTVFMISLNGLIDEYRIETALYRSGSSATEQILLAVRQADSVDLINTVSLSSTTGAIALQSTGTSTEIRKVGDELTLEINSTEYGNIVDAEVVVDEFTVFHYPLTIGEFVRFELVLTATIGSSTKTASFSGGGSVRGAL